MKNTSNKIYTLLCLFVILLNSCMLVYWGDEFYPQKEPIEAWFLESIGTNIYTGKPYYASSTVSVPCTPWQELYITFPQPFSQHYLNIEAWISSKKKHNTLFVKEILCTVDNKTISLVKNKELNILEMEVVVDEKGNPILFDGNEYYMQKIYNPRSGWYEPFILGNVNTHKFIKGKEGEEKDITLTQIYSFENGPVKTETIKYKVKCGHPTKLFFTLFA